MVQKEHWLVAELLGHAGNSVDTRFALTVVETGRRYQETGWKMVGYHGIRGFHTDQTLEFCHSQGQPFGKQVGGADADSTVCEWFGVVSEAKSVSLVARAALAALVELVALAAQIPVGCAVLLSGNSLAVPLPTPLLDGEGPQEQTAE